MNADTNGASGRSRYQVTNVNRKGTEGFMTKEEFII